MITFKEFMVEAKQVGNVFHFTTLPLLNDIINQPDPFLISKSKNNETFSVTRNHRLNQNPHFIECNVIIILDGDKISEHYKIRPVAGFAGEQSGVLDIHSPYSRVERSRGEAEEAIIEHPINIKKYIKHIRIQPSRWDKQFYTDSIARLDALNITHSHDKGIPRELLS